MLKFKRIIFSLTLFGISLLTMVATTFAWVGITSNSAFDEFSIDLKVDNDTGNYGIQLSLDGRPGTFADSIDDISIKRQLLKNWGYASSTIDKASDDYINVAFNKNHLNPCTPRLYNGNIFDSENVQVFDDVLTGNATRNFYYLDVFVSIYISKGDSTTSSAVPLFLRESILSSNDIGKVQLLNNYTFPSTSIYHNGTNLTSPLAGYEAKGEISVNPASAARVCIQKFDPVGLYVMTSHTSSGYRIYQYDDYLPGYDPSNDIFAFGGILPEEHNMAYQQFNLIHSDKQLDQIPEWEKARDDVKFVDSGTIGQVCTLGDGLTTDKMMMFRMYFWFEGWDADCFEVIDKKNVNVNLSFSTKGPDDIL